MWSTQPIHTLHSTQCLMFNVIRIHCIIITLNRIRKTKINFISRLLHPTHGAYRAQALFTKNIVQSTATILHMVFFVFIFIEIWLTLLVCLVIFFFASIDGEREVSKTDGKVEARNKICTY